MAGGEAASEIRDCVSMARAHARSRAKRGALATRFNERLTASAPERLPAGVLLQEFRERGYTGGYTMVKVLVASLKPHEAAAPNVRFETGLGEQMQVDWAEI